MFGYGFRQVNRSILGAGGASNPLWNGLQAYYTADNTPNDALGNYNGTLVNGATYGTGIINQGFSLDGVNDYVDFGTSVPIITGAMTLSYWFKGTWQGVNVGGLGRLGGGAERGFQFGSSVSNDFLRFDLAPTLTSLKQLTYTHGSTFNPTQWYHAVAVFSPSNYMRIYLDGVQVAETTTTIPASQAQSSSIELTFNNRGLLNGVADEIAIFERVLTPTEITELYNSGAGLQYPSGGSYGALTQAWISATGESDTTILDALNVLEADISSISGLVNLYPFVGADATKHSYNFLDTSLNPFTWSGGLTHDSNGVKGNGTNGYGTNGWIASSNFGMGIYLEDSGSLPLMSHIGTYNGTGQLIMMSDKATTLTADYFNQNSTTGDYFPNVNHAIPFEGVMSMGRTSTTDVHARIKGTTYTGTETQNTQTLSPTLLARQNTSNVSLFSDFTVKFLYQGNISLADQITLEGIINTFQTSLSRNV